VEEYRAYFVGHDGHFNGFEPLICADDGIAIEKAKRLVGAWGVGRGTLERPSVGCPVGTHG
jgi:hypothetical protein